MPRKIDSLLCLNAHMLKKQVQRAILFTFFWYEVNLFCFHEMRRNTFKAFKKYKYKIQLHLCIQNIHIYLNTSIVFCLISSYFGLTLIFKIMKEEITLIDSAVSFFMQIKSARIFILALFGRRSLICCAYQWTGVYMIGTSIMKELIAS